MKRALVIHPSDADYETSQLVRTIAHDTHGGADFVSIGRGGLFRDWISAARNVRSRRPAVIHAISSPALRAAACNGTAPILFTPTSPATTIDTLLRGLRDVQFVLTSQAWLPLLNAISIRAHVMPTPTALAVPDDSAATLPATSRSARNALRAELGFSSSDIVIVAPGESTRHSDHRLAVWVALLLHVLDERCRLLLWGRGDKSEQMQRFADGMNFEKFVVSAEPALQRKVWHAQLLQCADAIVDTSTELGGLFATAEAFATGLPAVLANGSAGASLVAALNARTSSKDTSAVVCKSRKAKFLAMELLELIHADDRSNTSRLGKLEVPRSVSWTDFYNNAALGMPLPNPI